MPYSTLELCSGGGAFEAVPTPRIRIDLEALRVALEREGADVVDARVMLIVRTEPETTVSRDGRIVLKTRDRKAAEVAFHHILELSGVRTEESKGRRAR